MPSSAAGLKVDGGILVDHDLRTSAPDIYAAGDVARFYNRALGKFLRVEHEDNANTTGHTIVEAFSAVLAPDKSTRYRGRVILHTTPLTGISAFTDTTPMSHALLVDDDEGSLAALAELVGREGFTTDVAGTLREGREKMSARRPDLVLLDIYLPDGNGMDLFEDVESRSTTEVVLMTGQPSLQTSIDALRLGAADYLIKPVNLKHLKGILSRVARPTDFEPMLSKGPRKATLASHSIN